MDMPISLGLLQGILCIYLVQKVHPVYFLYNIKKKQILSLSPSLLLLGLLPDMFISWRNHVLAKSLKKYCCNFHPISSPWVEV